MFNHPSISIGGRTRINIGAAAQTGVLDAGVHNVWNEDGETYIKVSTGTASDVTDETGHIVPAGTIISVVISAAGYRIGASAGASIMRVD